VRQKSHSIGFSAASRSLLRSWALLPRPSRVEAPLQPLVVVALWMIWFLSWLAAAMLDPRSKKLSTLQGAIYKITTLIGGFTLLFGFLPDPGFDIRNMIWPTLEGQGGWALVWLIFAAFCFAWVARAHIGFVLPDSKKKHPEFVETGPYRLLRQPIYLALIVAAFATAAIFGRPSSFGAAALLAVAFLVKMLIEEQTLREQTGAYDDYIDRVPMLLPFLPKRGIQERAEPAYARMTQMSEPVASAVMAEAAVPDPPSAPPEEPESVAPAELPAAEPEDEVAAGEPATNTVPSKAVQLSLALDGPDGTKPDQPTDRESPRGPSSTELRPTSAA
jgi:protein-S-isoprenylcysteine O-methyltransferase Ste14